MGQGVSRYLSIKDCARESGASASVLRIWELRYGWPAPRRAPNGYRMYRADLVPQIRAIQAARAKGVLMVDLIKDGLPILPRPERTGPTRAEILRPVLEAIPAPEGDVPRMLQRRLVDALIADDEAVVRECRHAASTIHPLLRELTVYRPLRDAEAALAAVKA